MFIQHWIYGKHQVAMGGSGKICMSVVLSRAYLDVDMNGQYMSWYIHTSQAMMKHMTGTQ